MRALVLTLATALALAVPAPAVAGAVTGELQLVSGDSGGCLTTHEYLDTVDTVPCKSVPGARWTRAQTESGDTLRNEERDLLLCGFDDIRPKLRFCPEWGRWRPLPAENGLLRFQETATGQCLTAPSDLTPCGTDRAQLWLLRPVKA
ncbi:hypothetical protein D5S17_13890 [Pseudonocardiaceae bacterium YIM PH 21723]|nr:hypothetical protein D5S17_13890 [Pseudonocardiaceae bacterium YIM PH 21723]